MIFDGYDKYIVERKIDLSKYMKDNDSIENFHNNFFKDEGGSFFDDFNFKSLFTIFGSEEEKSHGLIDQLSKDGVNAILLILPQNFIANIINIKNQNSNSRVRPREFSEKFMNQFASEFTKNHIDFSFILNHTHTKKNMESLESWLNIELLLSELNLNDNEAYILGLKGIKTDGGIDKAISVNLNGENITLKENNSMILANSELFKYSIPSQDSIVTINNNTSANYIDITTDGIDSVKTNNEALQEDLSYGISRFSVKLDDLDSDDVDLTFNDSTTLFLSKTITKKQTPVKNKKQKELISSKTKEKQLKKEQMIGTDTDNTPTILSINSKNRYLVNLKHFKTPYENGLVEIHYHLVKISNKLILIGGSKIDKQHKAVAKVVAKISSGEFQVTNLSNQPITFTLGDKKIEYKVRKAIPKPKLNYIDTDEDETAQNTQEVSIAKGESHSFDKKIEFPNSAIEFVDSGVAIEYINFTIGSFNNKLEFNRLYYSHFGTGNIIDNRENLDYAGRIFEDGTKKILGSSISSQPLVLTLKGDSFTLSNSIKRGYSVTLKTPTIDQELEYQEEHSISKNDLLSNSNTLTINKKGVTLVEISIIAK